MASLNLFPGAPAPGPERVLTPAGEGVVELRETSPLALGGVVVWVRMPAPETGAGSRSPGLLVAWPALLVRAAESEPEAVRPTGRR